MKTEISRFCEACLNSLQPLPPVLAEAAEHLEIAGVKTPLQALLREPLAALNDLRARLRSLVEKLASQQAYLLIFGPLKSGKSTLMNAISGAYVSEVTSLPGYPCLVFVRHGEEPHFSVTRYNGRESVFASGGVLKEIIADSHVALAEQIRVAEERGEAFDPAQHFTEAIRRVDVKLPVQSLHESGTVLVDTPGLYSRMNFGYDVLTREFRDSAACALFVVKTDNLFLEQVFAEFSQLLGLFSRIFLIINLDSNKRDLLPDGSLQPSAESHHPEKIIEAFKTLSMAGPLRQAYHEKRLRIHAVDLLSAASAFLKKDVAPVEDAVEDRQKNAFDAFQRDLTEYLNSSDYTLAFIRDSLRQGTTICAQARDICAGEEVRQLREKQVELRTQIDALEIRIGAADRLLAADWDAAFENVRAENARRSEGAALGKGAELEAQMREALDRWFASTDSLSALAERYWNPLLVAAGAELTSSTRHRLADLLRTPLGGAEPPALVLADLHEAGFNLAAAAHGATPLLSAADAPEMYPAILTSDEIPVRKSLADWLLFRRAAAVRRRVFGENDAQELPPEEKQKRLPEISRDALHQKIDALVRERFPRLPMQFSNNLLAGYVAKFRGDIMEGMQHKREQLARERTERQTPHDTNARIFTVLETLQQQAAGVTESLARLAELEKIELSALTDVAAATP